jgi:hypothetical protein
MSTDGGGDLRADRPMTTVDGGPDRPDAGTGVDANTDMPPQLSPNGATCHAYGLPIRKLRPRRVL